MPFILPEGIPEVIFVAVDVLGPKLAILTAVNPPPIILGLNYEYSVD